MRTKICDRFGIAVPIFGFSHCRDVVAAVSAVGGLGVLGGGGFQPDELEIELNWLDEHLQGRPYGVDVLMANSRVEGTLEDLESKIPQGYREFVEQLNQKFAIPPLRENAPPPGPGSIYQGMELRGTHGWAMPQLEVAFRHPIRLLVTALGPATPDVVERARELGIAIGGMVGSTRHAEKHIAAGAELLIATGTEGAGHNSDVATMVLVPEVVDIAGDVPVLAAGGIGNGRQIAAALALGAEGVWLGSIWLASEESDIEERVIQQFLSAGSHDTVRTKSWSGKPTRYLRNPWIDAWDAPGAPEPLPTPLQRILVAPSHQRIVAAGMTELVSVPIGQVVGQIHQRRRIRDIMFDLQEEYIDAVARLSSLAPDT